MRLFIAVNFSDQVKGQLARITQQLEVQAERGVFTRYENFHVTLSFLGETERVQDIQWTMDQLEAEPFFIELAEVGRFQRAEGDIYWIGVEKCGQLIRLQQELSRELVRKGFRLEERAFVPHLTLGRQVRLKKGFDVAQWKDKLPQIKYRVEGIDLMKSERTGRRLVYTPIYEKKFI